MKKYIGHQGIAIMNNGKCMSSFKGHLPVTQIIHNTSKIRCYTYNRVKKNTHLYDLKLH